MFQQLYKYLAQFQTISIPSVGTIELVQQPARLDIVEKLIYPPLYQTRFEQKDEVSQHQLDYFSQELQTDQSEAQKALNHFGAELASRIKKEAFTWTGIGTFQYNNGFHFTAGELINPLLPVRAEKVLRENVQHSVLVGDQVVYSDGSETIDEPSGASVYKIIAWVLIALAAAFIVFYLYQHQFRASASGLQSNIESAQPVPTYK